MSSALSGNFWELHWNLEEIKNGWMLEGCSRGRPGQAGKRFGCMKLVDHGLPDFGCFSQGLGFENGGFLVAVDDVVHPTAQGIDGVNRSALVGLERAEGRIEGG